MKSSWTKIFAWLFVACLVWADSASVAPDDSSQGKKEGLFASIARSIEQFQSFGQSSVSPEEQLRVTERTSRFLREEHWKIRVVFGEIDKLMNALADLRDLQLYPAALTRVEKKWAAKYDKRLEKEEKRIKKMRDLVDELYRPLLDAIAIVREMALGEINLDMLEILRVENRERVIQILGVKRNINDEWNTVNRLFEEMAQLVGMVFEKEESGRGFDAEFFAILNSNLGRSSDLFYDKVKAYRDSLASAGDIDSWKQMASVDMSRVRERMDLGLYDIVVRDLNYLSERYEEKIEIGVIHYSYGKTLLSMGRYREALEAFDKVESSSSYYSRSMLGKTQALFLLEDYAGTVELQGGWLDENLSGTQTNFAILLGAQSAYRIEKDDKVVEFATSARPERRFYAELLFTLSQVYLRKKDYVTAREILRKVEDSPGGTRGEAITVPKSVLAQGYISFEERRYEQAVKEFFRAMEEPSLFAEALFGIVWAYSKAGHTQEAEITLRKLINQNPDHPLAVEGILVLAKKMVAQAELEWQYRLFYDEEGKKLKKLHKSFEKRKKEGFIAESAISDLQRRLDSLDQVHISRQPLSQEGIGKLYDMAEHVCAIVIKNYRSGYYLETTTTGRREQLISELDELFASIQARKNALSPDEIKLAEDRKRKGVSAVKQAVKGTYLFKVGLLIKRRNWEKETSELYLGQLSERIGELREETGLEKDSLASAVMQKRLAKLETTRDAYLEIAEQENAARRRQIMTGIRFCRREYKLNAEEESRLLYQYAELMYEEEKDAYIAKLGEYEAALAHYDSLEILFKAKAIRQMPEPPQAPGLDYSRVIPICRRLAETYPTGPYTDGALYLLGYCYNDLGMDTLSHRYFELLVGTFPKSPYAPQSYMIIGEFWFDHAELENALAAYSKVMEFPDSEWFDEAIYKMGWTYYRLSRAKKAISSFVYLMSDSELKLGGASADKTKSLLEKESIDYIAISFAEEDTAWEGGVEKAKNFINRIDDDRKGARILHKLADVYRAQGTEESLNMARDAYHTLLDMFPDYENNPRVESDLVVVYEKDNRPEKANQMRLDVFRKYNREGDWAKSKADSSVIAFGDSIAQNALYDAANYFILDAAQNSDVGTYKKAMQAYQRYVKAYPKNSKTAECHYNTAEIMFSLGNYDQAAEEYMKVSRLYMKSEHHETAAWNAIVSAQNYKKRKQKPGGKSN